MLISIRLAPPSSPTACPSSSTPAKGSGENGAQGQQQQQQQQQPEEWSLLELNGTVSASLTGGSNAAAGGAVGLDGLSLGQLSFAAPDKPVLVIGAHKLEGEIKKLPKPFLIMQKQRKRKRAASVSNDPATPGGNSGGGKRAALGEETPMSGGRATPTPDSVDRSSAGLASPSPGGQGHEQDGGVGTEYAVVGIVRQKLLFQNRPKPIVSKHLIK